MSLSPLTYRDYAICKAKLSGGQIYDLGLRVGGRLLSSRWAFLRLKGEGKRAGCQRMAAKNVTTGLSGLRGGRSRGGRRARRRGGTPAWASSLINADSDQDAIALHSGRVQRLVRFCYYVPKLLLHSLFCVLVQRSDEPRQPVPTDSVYRLPLLSFRLQ